MSFNEYIKELEQRGKGQRLPRMQDNYLPSKYTFLTSSSTDELGEIISVAGFSLKFATDVMDIYDHESKIVVGYIPHPTEIFLLGRDIDLNGNYNCDPSNSLFSINSKFSYKTCSKTHKNDKFNEIATLTKLIMEELNNKKISSFWKLGLEIAINNCNDL